MATTLPKPPLPARFSEKSAVLCTICSKWCSSKKEYNQHVLGKKHLDRADAVDCADVVAEEPAHCKDSDTTLTRVLTDLVSGARHNSQYSQARCLPSIKAVRAGRAGPGAALASSLVIREYVKLRAAEEEEQTMGVNQMESSDSKEEDEEQLPLEAHENGVLLFYQYFPQVYTLDCVRSLRVWQLCLCVALRLTGRIRLAIEGINGTVGGHPAALAVYKEALLRHPLFHMCEQDFKTGLRRGGAACFKSLRVQVTTEICTLGLDPSDPLYQVNNGGVHLSPQAFHNILLGKSTAATVEVTSSSPVSSLPGSTASASASSSSSAVATGATAAAAATSQPSESERETVLLDCRNLYEAAVGVFQSPLAGQIPTLLPPTRQFSEFPKVAEKMVQEHDLRNKRVLMYCTGGIRCERGSAVLKSLGVSDVYQLSGGVHKYLEAFPDGGAFKGQLFVFDERQTVAPNPRAASSGSTTQHSTAYTPAVATATPAEHEDDPMEMKHTSGHLTAKAAGSATTASASSSVAVGDVVGRCVRCAAACELEYKCLASDSEETRDLEARCQKCRARVLLCSPCSRDTLLSGGDKNKRRRKVAVVSDPVTASSHETTDTADDQDSSEIILCYLCSHADTIRSLLL